MKPLDRAERPALTIRDQGPSVTFPVTMSTISCSGLGSCTGTGTLTLSGAYNAATLGGSPSSIQVLVSNTPNGTAISGCTPCNWGTLSGTISGGAWSGTIAGIPGGGPYYVSVRAANGTAYATLPSGVKVGFLFDVYGQGQVAALPSGQSGTSLSYFEGLWGYAGARSTYGGNQQYLNGPPVLGTFVPSYSISAAGDRFGVTGSTGPALSEGAGALEQDLTNAFGWPAEYFATAHDGVGIVLQTLGNAAQSQTVGLGNGSLTTWCSSANYCSNVSGAGPLYFNTGSLTGATLVGASVSGTTLSVPATTGLSQGALSPGMLLTDLTGHIAGSPKLVNCLTGCSISAYSAGSPTAQTWTISVSQTVSAETMRADPVGGTAWPAFNPQEGGLPYSLLGYGSQIIQAGTFSLSVGGTTVCTDTQTFAYSETGSTTFSSGCTGFINYQTGDFSITPTVTPANNAAVIASWTNIISPEPLSNQFNRPTNLDYFGTGGSQTGFMSSMFDKAPGGVSGHINSGCSTDEGYIRQSSAPVNLGYQYGAPGYSQMVSWLYGTKFPNLIPGMSAAVPQIVALQYRNEGGEYFYSSDNLGKLNMCDQWGQDFSTSSTFSGTISGTTLTLTSASVGPMWEGEVIGITGVASPIHWRLHHGTCERGLGRQWLDIHHQQCGERFDWLQHRYAQ